MSVETTMSQEQQTALKNMIIEMSCLVSREAEKVRSEYPDLQIAWHITVDAQEDTKTWLGSMVGRETLVRHNLQP